MNFRIVKMEIVDIEIKTGGKFGEGKKLTLNNFMLFERAEIDWGKNINVICGEIS